MSSNNEGDVKKAGSCSSGFFGRMFGGKESATEMCSGGCGETKCNCNCALKDHLKDCCGYGQRPSKIIICEKPTASCAPPPPQNSSSCGCASSPVKTESVPAFKPNAVCTRQDPPCGKCPPMPASDLSGCTPGWMCTPPIINPGKQYQAPPGACILPISTGGRNGIPKGGKCGSNSAAPNVANKDCPAVRPYCPGVSDKTKDQPASGGGFFSKISSFFGGGSK